METIKDDEVFNDAALRSSMDIEAALNAIIADHEAPHWYAALAVYMGSAIRAARREQGMPKQTAQMLIEAIRDFSLADEGTAGSQRLHSACNALAPP